MKKGTLGTRIGNAKDIIRQKKKQKYDRIDIRYQKNSIE